jgi:glucose/arabinose dehydrogenase
MTKHLPILLGFLASSSILITSAYAQGAGVPAFKIRDGLSVSVAAQNYGQSRFIELGDQNFLYVSQPQSGTVTTLKRDRNGIFTKVAEFVKGKDRVHGMQFKDGWLWYAESGAIWKARDTNADGVADEDVKVVGGLAEGGGHWYRTVLVDDDGFYTSIGDSGNVSDQTDTERQKIWKYSLDGASKTLFATGLRNTEKLRFRPGTKQIWGADHGSDNFGKNLGERGANQPVTDRIPPCEFNLYVQDGFYGHPFIVGNGMPRPEYATRPDILELAQKTILPAWPLGAHWAPNGWTFTTKNTLGNAGDAYIANHGSWNSSKKVGYRVEHIIFDKETGMPMGSQFLIDMIGPNGNNLDRPVDCAEDIDGSLLISAASGKIYRVKRK